MKSFASKGISCLLAVLIIAGTCLFSVTAAENNFPESEHNYQNNTNKEWYYEYFEKADGLYITFSEKTSFEKPTMAYIPIVSGPNGEVISGGTMEKVKDGDSLTLKGMNGYSLVGTGDELSGKTVYVPGNSFYLYMQTDATVTAYGFSIDRISDKAPENVAVVSYNCCDKCDIQRLCYNEGEEIKVAYNYYCKTGNSAFVSWMDEEGAEYNEGDSLEFTTVNLKTRRVPLLLDREEVFSFANSDPYFDPDYNGGYYITKEDALAMQKNIFKVFGVGILPAVGLSVAFSTYPSWQWNGSCYGMSALAYLQHYKVVDILENRSEKSISELTNEDSVISMINYYQWSAAGSFLCENFALEKGSKMYSQQLKNVFESVSNGNIVMFTYYPAGIFEQSGHTVLFTGAYTQKDGTKVLISYDCNFPEDYKSGKFERRFYIDPEFKTIMRDKTFGNRNIGAFNWTDDYAHFESFDINNGGKAVTWYIHFFSQLFNLVKSVFELF